MKFPSLRSRLLFFILLPLSIVALITVFWQFYSETERAEDTFDRRLLSAALAISRDVAISDGDALSPATRQLLNNTSGGELFYHVYAPDGVFVTGYATPPVAPAQTSPGEPSPVYFDARYQSRDVRALRFQYVTTVADVSGAYNVTVWQDAAVRRSFVYQLVARSVAMSVLVVAAVGLIVWFGVGFGLRPLIDLEEAIARRSGTDLNPIKRDVPREAKGVVTTLNSLLDRISRRISSKDEFISNAAHQLRNPIAAVLALAEAVQSAPHPEAAKVRSAELLKAARQTSRLANQLLSFERAAGSDLEHTAKDLDLAVLVGDTVTRFLSLHSDSDFELLYVPPSEPVSVRGDPVMLREAILNLLDNAVAHGGAGMTHIKLQCRKLERTVHLLVEDNGQGIPENKREQVMMRFAQANDGTGSGLGLAIASRVMAYHSGAIEILDADQGARIKVELPLAIN